MKLAPMTYGFASVLFVAAGCGRARTISALPESQECTLCHGSADNAAPPKSLQGSTDTSSIAVGAHQSHVRGGTVSVPISCSECHVVPARLDSPGHMDGRVDVRFGPLATTDAASQQWDRATAVCSGIYCHGATLSGGSITAPRWTTVDGTQAACGACHGIPPPPPHVQNSNCGSCHLGYTPTSINPTTHVNHNLEVIGLSCTSCHGDRTSGSPAPPVDTRGNTATTEVGVGAHEAHLQDGPVRVAVACTDCHVVPSSVGHSNGTPDLTFSALASAGGLSPRFDVTTATCASTYCHGSSLPGGSNTTPQWTKVDGTQAACGTCHGVPPAETAGHPYAAASPSACARCHPGTVREDGSIDTAGGLHVDGAVEFQLSCTSCHGDPSRQPAAIAAAPPSGTSGETDPSTLAVGAHLSHLRDSPIRKALDCTECHVVPTATNHSDGTVDVAFGVLARTGGASPQWDSGNATCSGTYCHGATLGAGGTIHQPRWTTVDGTQAACGTCHGVPPPGHAPSLKVTQCYWCHLGTVNPDGTINVSGGKHIDGRVQAGGG